MKSQTIRWGKFGDKHKEYIKRAIQSDFNVAEGAIRAGKTIDHCIIACMELEECPDKLHLASGSTLPNAKLNIGACNGFGLENLFRGRCRWGKYKDNEALYINTKTGEKIVIFVGGGKADSYKKILGNSYGMWIATEINEHYDSQDSRTSFIKVAMGRQLASKKPFTLWDLNPCYPSHKIYTDYIDAFHQTYKGKYNYQHFTIKDNATMSEEEKAKRLSHYQEGSIWYKRDILGMRCVAEGLVFKFLADEPEPYITEKKEEYSKITMGIDFGGNGSKTTFFLMGYKEGYHLLTGLEERETENKDEIDSQTICDTFIEFYEHAINEYGRVDWVFPDNASPTMINTLKTEMNKKGYNSRVVAGCYKGELKDRPKLIEMLLVSGRLKIKRNCHNTIKSLQSLVWDKKNPDIPEDKNINNVNDWYDSFYYSFSTFQKYIEQDRRF
jgi:PBSX family phage terminase large subunit